MSIFHQYWCILCLPSITVLLTPFFLTSVVMSVPDRNFDCCGRVAIACLLRKRQTLPLEIWVGYGSEFFLTIPKPRFFLPKIVWIMIRFDKPGSFGQLIIYWLIFSFLLLLFLAFSLKNRPYFFTFHTYRNPGLYTIQTIFSTLGLTLFIKCELIINFIATTGPRLG